MSNPAPTLKKVPTEEPATVPSVTGSKKKKIIIAIIIVAVLVVASAAATLFLEAKDPTNKELKKSVEKMAPAIYLPLDSFTVNLQSENGDKYLQTSITLQVRNEEQLNYYKGNMPQLRSRILLLLSNKSADELLTPEGKVKLTDEIIKSLQLSYTHSALTPQEVEDHRLIGVFFTSFMIQ